MRVFADKIASHVLQNLGDRGFELHSNPKLKAEDLEIAIRIFSPKSVVRSTKVTNNHLISSDKLALVIRAGAGVNTIDLDSVVDWASSLPTVRSKRHRRRKIGDGPHLNADRRIADNVAALRAGEWKKTVWTRLPGHQRQNNWNHRTWQYWPELTRRAQAFDMTVLGYDPFLSPNRASQMG